ncbi:Low temperature requirement protein LtrA [Micromonospora echinaurantiaca]|uniref:Low temperature requirement protein LtrA n=1 Tax=Micromonospora echinaurantiaca TaxID=47857 RepID=A0A1C5KAX2_9ACTN|nr:low temperature requirement protein A [Micromonospora echinaurantiaca]SCG79898.1 Low temperature requirement protein LtrA [Micromonospora echinaurantiaca]
MKSGSERLLRRRDDPIRTSFLELLFDLSFVLPLSQLSSVLLADLSVPGALRAMLLLAPVFWVWLTVISSTDWYDPGTGAVRLLLGGAALGSLLMGVAVPEALDDRALMFAAAYVAVHLGRGLIVGVALRRHPLRRRTLRVLTWYGATSVLWLAGAFVPAVRVPLWLVALAVDLVGPVLGWPAPRLGRTRPDELRLSGTHVAERFQQIFIVSLGELILSAGLSYARAGPSPARTATFMLAFAVAVLIGLLYVTPAGVALAPAIDRSTPARLAVTVGYLHIVMIAGVVATAVGTELAIARPTEPAKTGALVVTVAGPTLFLAGRMLLSAAIYRRFSWPQLAALLAMPAVAVVTVELPLLVLAAATTSVLFLTAALDHTGFFAPRPSRPA